MIYIFFISICIFWFHTSAPQDLSLYKPSIQDQIEFCRELSKERIDDAHIKPIVEPYIFSYVTTACNDYERHDLPLLYTIIHNEPVAYEAYERMAERIIYNAMKNALIPYCVHHDTKPNKRQLALSAAISSLVTAFVTSSVSLLTYFLTNQDCSK